MKYLFRALVEITFSFVTILMAKLNIDFRTSQILVKHVGIATLALRLSQIYNNLSYNTGTKLKVISTKALTILLSISVLLGFFIPINSYGDGDDSCIKNQTIISKLISNVLSFGMFSAIESVFDMTSDDAEGETVIVDGQSFKRCNVPTDDIKFCFKEVDGDFSLEKHCKTAKNGDTYYFALPPAYMKIANIGDQLCVTVATLGGYQPIGCKYRKDPATMDLKGSCVLADSCRDNTLRNSQSLMPIAGAIVQCIKDSLDRIFTADNICSDKESLTAGVISFATFQKNMRDLIRTVLILYIASFGLKVVMSGDPPKKGEILTVLYKFIFVFYFSVGIYTGVDDSGNFIYKDGITTYLKPLFVNGSADLVNIVYYAGGSEGLCQYDIDDYKANYSYLATWDAMDCRILYALGASTGLEFAGDMSVKNLITYIAKTGLKLLLFPFTAFLSLNLVYSFLSIAFIVFFISIMMFFTHMFVVSIIAVSILLYLAPIFVPLFLFEKTKSYFSTWLNFTIGYSLQPVVVSVFMAMLLTIFDQAMYKTCVFDSIQIPGTIIKIFHMQTPDKNTDDGRECANSFGYRLGNVSDDIEDIPMILFNVSVFSTEFIQTTTNALATVTLFLFLFYYFSEMVYGFAADLTNTQSFSKAVMRPNEGVGRMMSLAKAIIKAKTGDSVGAIKELDKAANGADSNITQNLSNPQNSGSSVSRSGNVDSGSSVSSASGGDAAGGGAA